MIIQAKKAVVGQNLVHDFWVEITDGIITECAEGINKNADIEINGVLIPGFIDIHCHGGDGFYFSDVDDQNIRQIIEMHQKRGSTSLMASLVTEPIPKLKVQISRLLPFFKDGSIIGIHLEGPYLSHAKCGAHDPALLKTPTIEEIEELIEISEGAIKMITIAPELQNAISVIKLLKSKNIKAAIGHTDASPDQFQVACNAGASLITHFTNGMSKSMGPGTLFHLITENQDYFAELILDGVHVDLDLSAEILEKMKERIILITDAMSAANQSDGQFMIGNKEVVVMNSIARLIAGNNLAGSTLTMDKAFSNAISKCGLNLIDAVAISSSHAAKQFNLNDRGVIQVGKRADLLTYDEVTGEITNLSKFN